MALPMLLFPYSIMLSYVCKGFNRNTTGVVFSPYVKLPDMDSNEVPDFKTYTFKDVDVMLNVVSTKFSRVTTYGVGLDTRVNYPENQKLQYYYSYSLAMAAELAAKLNRQKGGKRLTILIGIWQFENDLLMDTEIQVAKESAKRADSIFDGTVEGFVFSGANIDGNLLEANRTLQQLNKLRKTSSNQNLKLGSRQICSYFIGNSSTDELTCIGRGIVVQSDFIICRVGANESLAAFGAKVGFNSIKSKLLDFRREFRKMNPVIEVMGETGWPSAGDKEWENLENLGEYWKEVNQWSAENNYPIWLLEAFDQPWKTWTPNQAHYGWWQLACNKMVDRQDGYVEKVSGLPLECSYDKNVTDIGITNAPTPWIYVAFGVVVLLLALALVLLSIFNYYSRQWNNYLTSYDVEEFINGISARKAAELGCESSGSVTAYQLPYDKSFDIPQDKIKIQGDCLLGAGQFGCVYKAIIDSSEGETIVALKTAKENCGRTVLLGILSEIKILIYLGKHPNIINIYGACTENLLSGKIYIALELCKLGSLKGYLRKRFVEKTPSNGSNCVDDYLHTNYEEPTITREDLLQWSYEIACGMEHLTSKNVVHADLSTRNILLTADKIAKIAAFGLSRKLYDYNVYVKKQQEPLPWRWMSIESLKRLEFSSKSDVWSYGVTIWEIFSLGDIPYPGYSWNSGFVQDLIDGLRMERPQHATNAIYIN